MNEVGKERTADAAVYESERRFRRIFEHAAVGIAEVSCSGDFLLFNDTFCSIAGYSRAQLEKMSFQQITHPDDLGADTDLVRQVAEGHLPRYAMDKRYIRADGSIVWVRLTVAGIRKEDGSLDYFISVIEDISERKMAEAARRESEERFSAFMANSPVAAWIVDRAGRFHYGSPMYCEILNLTKEQLLGKTIDDLFPVEIAGTYKENNEAVFRSHSTVETVEPTQMRAGGVGQSLVVKFPIQSNDGETLLGGLALDITAHLENERALKEALEAAEGASRAKSFFLANMSHEIRTPLNAILGFAELLRASELTREESAKYTDIIIKNGWHLLSLIEDLLDVTRVETDRMALEKICIRLSTLLEDVREMLAPAAESAHIMLQWDLSPSCPDCFYSDPTRLRQVLTNVVGNAIKFSPQGGTVKVGIEEREGMMAFTVQDSGVGIPLHEQEKIFDAFHQTDTSLQRRLGGAGLGLTLARKLSRLLGGDLVLKESGAGVGSTFVVTVALERP